MRSNDDETTLRKLLATLQLFRDINDRIPLSTVIAFLLVAIAPGRSLGDYAKLGGFPYSVTRLFQDLGDENRWKEPGLKLIESIRDGTVIRSRLSPTGGALVDRICGAFRCDNGVACP
jgi:hypothetical protein